MKHYSLSYFIGQAFQGLWRNGVMTFASITVLMSCLIVTGSFSLLVLNIDENLKQLGLLNEIEVFVEKGMTEEAIQQVEADIRSLDNVAAVKHTTSAEGLEEMREKYGDNAYLLDNIPEDTFTDSFTVTYIDNSKVSTLNYNLWQIDGVRKVNDRLDLAVMIENLKNGVLLVFTWFLVILMVVSIFIIVNTIKLAVFARRQEISIMSYVGATRTFITLPFLFEGVIIGLFSGSLAFLCEWYLYRYIEKMVAVDLQMLSILRFDDIKSVVFMGFIAIGIITGIVGSSISLTRYLKE